MFQSAALDAPTQQTVLPCNAPLFHSKRVANGYALALRKSAEPAIQPFTHAGFSKQRHGMTAWSVPRENNKTLECVHIGSEWVVIKEHDITKN